MSSQIRDIAASMFNHLLNLEMSVFLGDPGQAGNKRNGFQRDREYHFKGLGTLRLRIPRDRDGAFRSIVVPGHERMDPRLREDLAILQLAGVSTRMLADIGKRVLAIDVSSATVASSMGPLKAAADVWMSRQLTEPYWALYVDGTNFSVQRRGSTEKEPSLVVLGVSETNRRSILAIEPGARENIEAWRAAFRSLKQRGLDAAAVRVGVMDGLPGLENLFREEFPNAVTARCWTHALRNAKAVAPKRLQEAFVALAHKVMYAASEDAARQAFEKLKEAMGDDGQKAVSILDKDLESLLAHYKFDQRFWQALRTANAVERVHRELKRRTKAMDSVGESSLKVIVTFTALRLEAGWQRHPIDSRAAESLTAPKRGKHRGRSEIEQVVDEIMTIQEET